MAWTPKSLRGLQPYLRRYRRALAMGIGCAIAADLVSLWHPRLLGWGLDVIDATSTARGEWTSVRWRVAGYAAALIATVAVEGAFAWAMRRLMTGTSRHIEYDLQHDLFAHLLAMPASAHDRLRGGDMLSRLTNDLAAVRDVVGPGLMWLIQTAFQTVAVASVMLWINPGLALYALAPLPVLWLVTVWASRAMYAHSYAAQEALSALSQRATVAFGGIRVVQAFEREPAERAAFAELDGRYVRENLAQGWVRGLFMSALMALPGIAAVAVLWGGGLGVAAGTLSKGDLIAFLAYVAMLVRPMLYLGWTVTIHQHGAAALARVREVLAERPEDRGGAAGAEPVMGALAWREVTVGYGAAPPALRGLTLQVPAGEFLAVVGPVASGKSSLLQTLPRLLDPPPGQAFVDGVDVRAWPLDALRGAIGYVPQLPFLFSASVRDNIRLGTTRAASDADIAEAASAAGLDPDLATWPEGLDTVVGERGVAVSGGQRQRIAIARALLADAPILLLDDCLSSLDAETAERILARLRAARHGAEARRSLAGAAPSAPRLAAKAGRTTVLATHRIAEAARCQRVAVLDHGRVVQLGTHAALAAAPGLYARLVERQRLEAAIEAPA